MSGSDVDLGAVMLPEGKKMCWITGSVYTTGGLKPDIDRLAIDGVEMAKGQRIQLVPLGARIGHPPCAPLGYHDENAFSILHLPAGRYQLTVTTKEHGSTTHPLDLLPGQGVEALKLILD